MACTALGDYSGATALYFDMLQDQMQKRRPESATLPKTLVILTSLENIAGIYSQVKKYATAEMIY
jgi:hypothetical protein